MHKQIGYDGRDEGYTWAQQQELPLKTDLTVSASQYPTIPHRHGAPTMVLSLKEFYPLLGDKLAVGHTGSSLVGKTSGLFSQEYMTTFTIPVNRATASTTL